MHRFCSLFFFWCNGTLFQGVLESTLGTGGSGKVAHHVIKLCKIYGDMSQSCATPSTSSINLVYDPTTVLFSKIIDLDERNKHHVNSRFYQRSELHNLHFKPLLDCGGITNLAIHWDPAQIEAHVQ